VIIDNIDNLIRILTNELEEAKVGTTTFGQDCLIMGPKALNIFKLFERFLILSDEKVNCAIALSDFFPMAMVLSPLTLEILRVIPLEQSLPHHLLQTIRKIP
jgi:hypothetical protein